MKKLIFTIAFFTVCVTAIAQIKKDTVGLNIPVTDGKVIYTGVVEVDGKTKDDLYKRARQWFLDYFYTQKDVIEDEDRDDGFVLGRIAFPGRYYNVTIKIECKDNKYRYSFYNIFFHWDANTDFDIEQALGSLLGTQKWPPTKSITKQQLKTNDGFIRAAILSLKDSMGKTIPGF